jgi:fused signal recognition particle receptor
MPAMSNVFNKWKEGLAKTSKSTFGQIVSLVGASEITDETFEDLEALMIQADLGVETSEEILEALWDRERSEGMTKSEQLKAAFKEELRKRLNVPPLIEIHDHPTVILIVGVNGSGKTTTIAKLGKRFTEQGKSVLFGAADTFRAAAVDQLEIWSDRLDLPIVSGQQGGDAGAAAYDTVQSAKSRKIDVALIDTAGRLHTRFNLMEELRKVYRVLGKAMPLQQAQAFKDTVNVTGVILAKLDSSARGGMAFAIQRELELPILYAGLGEKPEDLEPFDPDAFVQGIMA